LRAVQHLLTITPPQKIKYFSNLDNVKSADTAPATTPSTDSTVSDVSSTVTYTETEMTINIVGTLANGESAVVHIDGKYIILNAGEKTAIITLSDTDMNKGQINQNNTTVTATYIQKAGTVYKYGDSTDGLDDISATSPEGAKYQDYIDEAVAKGTDPWVNDHSYNGEGTGLVSDAVKLVLNDEGNLGFDIAQRTTFSADGKLLLFTSTQNTVPFTFNLLFVKEGSETRGKFIENVDYLDPDVDPNDPIRTPGMASAGNYY